MPEQTFWIVQQVGEKANVSVCSEEEAKVRAEADDMKEWMIVPTAQASKDEMEERIEDHGLEFDPWV